MPSWDFQRANAACSALGLISETEAHDLNLIRRIRNDFAHDIHTTFDSNSVMERCKLLKMKAHDYTDQRLGEVKVGSAGQFQTAAVSLIMQLTNRPKYVGEERRLSRDWPY